MEDEDIYLVRFVRPGNNYWEISICDDPKIALSGYDAKAGWLGTRPGFVSIK